MLTIELLPDGGVILRVAGLKVATLSREAWSYALGHPVSRGDAPKGRPSIADPRHES